MNHRLCRLCIFVFSLFLIASALHGAEPVCLTFLHTSDTHGHIASDPDSLSEKQPRPWVGGFPLLKAKVEEIKLDALKKGNRAFLLDGGDYFQGTPIVEETKGQIMIDIMNRLNYLTAGIGNHDLDYGIPRLGEVLKSARHPIVCCNVFHKANGRLLANARSHIRLGHKGLNIAIIGALDPRTPDISLSENVEGLEFRDPQPILTALISRLRAQKVDLIVLLSHLGIENDRKIVAAVPGIDLVLGGHSHTEMREIEYAGPNAVPIIHPGFDTRYVSRVDLRVEPGKKLQVTFEPIFLTSEQITEHAGLTSYTNQRLSSISEKVSRLLGTCKADLVRGVIGGDSPEGNFVADAMREGTSSDIGFTNVGGIRVPIASGPVIWEKVFQLQPFNNTVEVVPMSGKQVTQLIEEGLSVDFKPADTNDQEYALKHFKLKIQGLRRDFLAAFGYLVPSNLLVTFDPERPAMSRIVKLTTLDGKPLEPDRTYKVAFNSYLSQGGDGYKYLKNWPGKVNSMKLVRDLVAEKIEKDSVIGPPAEVRMNNLKLSCVPVDSVSK